MSNGNSPRARVRKDLNALGRDTRDLLRSTVHDLGGEVQELGGKLSGGLGVLQRSARQGGRLARDRLKDGFEATSGLVHEYPYHSVAVVFGVGLLLGLIFRRRA